MRFSKFGCVAVGAWVCSELLGCGSEFSRLEAPERDASFDAPGDRMTGGTAGSAGSGGGSGGSSGRGGTGGRAGADAGSTGGKGGSAGGATGGTAGSSGRGGSAGTVDAGGTGGGGGRGGSAGAVDAGGSGGSGNTGGSGGSGGRGGSGGSVDAGGGAAGAAGQPDASRRDVESDRDASSHDAADVSVGTDGSGGSNPADAQTDAADGGIMVCSSLPPNDCALCCSAGNPDGLREYQQRMHDCACGDCQPQCAMSLCDVNAADPSVACLTCIRQRLDTATCAAGRDSCTQNDACSAYMTCAHGCFAGMVP